MLSNVCIRDGHAEADDAEVCGLMRICAYAEAIRKTKSVCAIVGKKTRSKIEQNWGAGARSAKTVKILNKNSQKSIKNRPKNGLKMVIFFYYCDVEMRIFAHRCAMIAHRQKLPHGHP